MKELKLRPLLGSLLTLALPVLLLGCSTAAMHSMPLRWDREIKVPVGPVENRVNLWPILYYSDPVWSVLWPFISATDQGSACIPVYEYDKPNDELRLLFVHQDLPSGAVFSGVAGYWRVLNVIRDTKDDTLFVLPLYFQDFKDQKLLVLPVFYKDRTMFWTPLVSRSPHLTGVLGPLFNVYSDGPSRTYNFPFPLAGLHRAPGESGFWLIPAVFYGRTAKTKVLNVGVVLFHYNRSDGSWSVHYAAFLGGAAREAGGDTHNYLAPLWVSWKSGDESCFVSLPFTRYQAKDYRLTNAFLNAWIDVRQGDSSYQSVLWPLYQRFQDPARRGHALLPFYYFARDQAGRASFYSLPFIAKNNGELIDILGPAFLRQRGQGGTYTAVAWPLAHAWNSPAGRGSMVLPLFYENRKTDGGRMLVTPLGGISKAKDEEYIDLAGPFYFHHIDKDGKYRTVLWPLAHAWENPQGHGAALLPLFYDNQSRDGSRVTITPLGGRAKSPAGELLDLAGPLFIRQRGPGGAYTAAPWPLVQFWNKGGEQGLALLPLVYTNQTRDGGRVLVTPLGGSVKSQDGVFYDVGGPLFIYNHDLKQDSTYRSLLWPFWHEWQNKLETDKLLLPLFFYNRDNRDPRYYTFASLPLSFGRERDSYFVNAGLLLFHRRTGDAFRSTWLLADLIGWEDSAKAKRTEAHAFPFFSYEDTPDFRATSVLTSGAFRSKKDEAALRAELLRESNGKSYGGASRLLAERHALLFVYKSTTRLVQHLPLPAAGAPAPGRPVVRKTREDWLFPLYLASATEGEGSQTNLLGPLYDATTKVDPADGSVEAHQRVLWYLFNRTAKGGDVRTDIFPFMTYDRGKNKEGQPVSRFTFAGGLFGHGTVNGTPYTQVLFMKF